MSFLEMLRLKFWEIGTYGFFSLLISGIKPHRLYSTTPHDICERIRQKNAAPQAFRPQGHVSR